MILGLCFCFIFHSLLWVLLFFVTLQRTNKPIFMIYPIGEQDFAGIRRRGLVYVDKTDLVYKMVNAGKYYFLIRPRRFGKTLLLSTLKSYFLGDKESFRGLAIEHLEKDWQQHPVLTLTLSKGKFDTIEDLHSCLRGIFSDFEKRYGRNDEEKDYAERFTGAIKRAYEQTGRQVVILIDEYDAPFQAAIDKPELMAQYQGQIRDIYLCLKKNDEYLRFVFLTGITAWGKVGVFSALNNLDDITFSKDYATICGITEEELHAVFHTEVERLARENELSTEEAYQRLKEQYDGYHFANKSVGVYNPFSLLRALNDREFKNYWIQTGETQLIANLVQHANIDINTLMGEVSMPEDNMLNAKEYRSNPYTFLYQAGYLTLKGVDPATNKYRLQVPNGEVRGSLASHLVAPTFGFSQQEASTFIDSIKTAMYYGRMEELVKTLNDYIFLRGNYMTMGPKERYCQQTLVTVFLCADYAVTAEAIGHKGRADLIVKTPNILYVIEVKLNGSAQQALAQINEKGYADTYRTDRRKIIKLGINFSEEERIIDNYAIEMPTEA